MIREAVHLDEVVPALIQTPFVTPGISTGTHEQTRVYIDFLFAADLYLVGERLVIQTLLPHMYVYIGDILLLGQIYGFSHIKLEVLHVRVHLTNFHVLHLHSFERKLKTEISHFSFFEVYDI